MNSILVANVTWQFLLRHVKLQTYFSVQQVDKLLRSNIVCYLSTIVYVDVK